MNCNCLIAEAKRSIKYLISIVLFVEASRQSITSRWLNTHTYRVLALANSQGTWKIHPGLRTMLWHAVIASYWIVNIISDTFATIHCHPDVFQVHSVIFSVKLSLSTPVIYNMRNYNIIKFVISWIYIVFKLISFRK